MSALWLSSTTSQEEHRTISNLVPLRKKVAPLDVRILALPLVVTELVIRVGLAEMTKICSSQVEVDNMTRNSCIPHLSFNNHDDHCCELGVSCDCSQRQQPDSPRRRHTAHVSVCIQTGIYRLCVGIVHRHVSQCRHRI